jgi:hypothetical protein
MFILDSLYKKIPGLRYHGPLFVQDDYSVNHIGLATLNTCEQYPVIRRHFKRFITYNLTWKFSLFMALLPSSKTLLAGRIMP